MAGGMESGSITERAVYRQDTEPDDKREGLLWVDTSGTGVTTKVYDGSAWASIVPNFPIFVTQEAVSFTESDVSTTPEATALGGGSYRFVEGGTVSRPQTDTESFDGQYNFRGIAFELYAPVSSIEVTLSSDTSGITRIQLVDKDLNVISEETGLNLTPGDTYTFNDSVPAGIYKVRGDGGGNGYDFGRYDGSVESSYFSPAVDLRGNVAEGGDEINGSLKCFSSVSVNSVPTSGGLTIGFDSVEDLAAWDRVSWQADDGDGSVTATVETNDGTGWSSFASDVAAPYSIASVPTDHDVRVRFDLSRPSASDTSPLISYVARRGER
jgi:hypothetical protein